MVVMAVLMAGCSEEERARYLAEDTARYTGWCKLNDCKGMSFAEFDALYDAGMLKQTPNSSNNAAASMAAGAVAGAAAATLMAPARTVTIQRARK